MIAGIVVVVVNRGKKSTLCWLSRAITINCNNIVAVDLDPSRDHNYLRFDIDRFCWLIHLVHSSSCAYLSLSLLMTLNTGAECYLIVANGIASFVDRSGRDRRRCTLLRQDRSSNRDRWGGAGSSCEPGNTNATCDMLLINKSLPDTYIVTCYTVPLRAT